MKEDSYKPFRDYSENAHTFCHKKQMELFSKIEVKHLKPETIRVIEEGGKMHAYPVDTGLPSAPDLARDRFPRGLSGVQVALSQ